MKAPGRRSRLELLGAAAASLVALHAGTVAPPAEGASDARFFGRYCGTHVETVTVRVRFLFWTVAERRGSITASVTAVAGYAEGPRGDGLISGTGEGRVARVEGDRAVRDRFGLEVGDTLPFTFSGVVTGRGRAQGSATAPSVGPVGGQLTLLDDGNTLVVRGMDRRLVLGKDRCGNTAPRAVIDRPAPGTVPWGTPIGLAGRASDAEDASFPDERLVWTSSRDGRLGTGRAVTRSFLSPGTHAITFSATDSGGLIATAAVTLTIANNPPNRPRIEAPRDGAVFYAGQPVTFRGSATDREDGNLTGPSLAWSSGTTPPLGTGPLIRQTLPEGTHTITLTASDRQDASNSASVRVEVRPRPAGNTPPTVAIRAPASGLAMGDTECVTLVAEGFDLEDGRLTGSAIAWQDRYDDGTGVRVRALGSGERIDLCNPRAGVHDTWHEVSVVATDGGGLASPRDSIRIYVIPGGLI